MSAPPAFQFYPADWLVGTLLFSLAEDGAYLRCVMHQWSTGSVPGDDIRALSRVMRVSEKETRDLWAVIHDKFIRCDDGLWRNARLETERAKQVLYRESQAENGRRSAAARAQRKGNDVPTFAGTKPPTIVATTVQPPLERSDQPNSQPNSTLQSSSSSSVPLSKNESGGRAPNSGLVASSRNWGLKHSECVPGFCNWMCLFAEDFHRFSARLGGDEAAMAWAKSVRSSAVVPTGKPWQFWNAQFDAAHGSVQTPAGGFSKADWDAHAPGGAIDKKLGLA